MMQVESPDLPEWRKGMRNAWNDRPSADIVSPTGGTFMKSFRLAATMTLAALSTCIFAQAFTQADLEKMVSELDSVGVRNAKYRYPIKCSVVDNKDVNAYASIEKPATEGEKPQAIMVVYSGLVKECNGELRLIRAVVAHEVAHLMQGHVASPVFVAKDLRFLWDRQQEMDADLTGAKLLEKAGYSRKDMMDMLAMLDKVEEESSWLWRLAKNDHTSAKNRAAEVGGNTDVLKSMMCFEKGLAFLECRRYNLSAKLFDQAIKQNPDFLDAYTNAAQASLMDYYDNLPRAVQDRWFRPDFGPMLTDNPIGGRDPEIRQEDRDRFKAAMVRIDAAKAKRPGDARVEELALVAAALDPDAAKAGLMAAGDALAAKAASGDKFDRVRFANNAGVAYHRAAELQKAYDTIIATLKQTKAFSNYLAQNLGRFNVPNRSKDDELLVLDVMVQWLNDAPTSNPYYKIVREAYTKGCTKAGVQEKEVKPRPTYLCNAVSMVIDGKESPLLVDTSEYTDSFGQPAAKLKISDQYPDVQVWRWPDGKVTLLTERGQVVKITSNAIGSYVDLKPSDPTVNTVFRVIVGMSEDDFSKILDLSKAVETKVIGATGIEVWSFYPNLMLGVQRKDGRIVGVTVSPTARG